MICQIWRIIKFYDIYSKAYGRGLKPYILSAFQPNEKELAHNLHANSFFYVTIIENYIELQLVKIRLKESPKKYNADL